jgi:hypothetical protein
LDGTAMCQKRHHQHDQVCFLLEVLATGQFSS